MEKMGDLIYSYGAKRFRTKEMSKKHVTLPLPKSRRQQQIKRPVRERRDLRKQWKRSLLEKRAGINLLQADLKGCLGRLGRA